jgi:PBP1b-binding outer membrane lipoprotein LpoB
MRCLLLALLLAGCPKHHEENLDPYKNVTPQKVKARVEKIQQQEDERNDKKLEDVQKQ